MAEWMKLPVGIEEFEKIRRNGFYYVDKTGLIEELLKQWGEVIYTSASFWKITAYEYAKVFFFDWQ